VISILTPLLNKAKPGKYRIVMEGLTPQGIPFKAEQFIIVE